MENCSTTWSLEESSHEVKKSVCLSGRGLKALTRELIEVSIFFINPINIFILKSLTLNTKLFLIFISQVA